MIPIEEKYPAATVTKYLEEIRKEYKKKGEEFPPEDPEDPDDEPTDPTTGGKPKKPKPKLPSDMFSYVGGPYFHFPSNVLNCS